MRAALLCLLLPALAVAGSCRPAPSARAAGRGVLIIAVDGLRADHVTALGYDRPTTPELDRLAGDGLCLGETYSTAPWLLPAHVSLLTGCDPNVARRIYGKGVEIQVERSWQVPERVPHLATEFLAAGWNTAAFVDHPWLAPVFGFAPGFQRYEVLEGEESGLANAGARLVSWLGSLPEGEPWFAYVHAHDLERIWARPDPRRDTHFAPRPGLEQVPPVASTEPVFFAVPPSRWDGGSYTLGEYEARYDGALLLLDSELGRLFETLRLLDLYSSTSISVVGTFGVQFGEAGLILDHGCLSMADLRVPWVLKPAADRPLGPPRVVPDLVSTSDIAPTLLEQAGLAIPAGMHGLSLAAGLASGGPLPRELAISTCGYQEGYIVIGRRWCLEVLTPALASNPSLVRTWYGEYRRDQQASEPRERLYDHQLTPFPGEEPGAQPEPGTLERLRNTSVKWASNIIDLRMALHSPGEISAERKRELVALGYLGEAE